MDVFQGLPSNSVPLCLTSWENQKKSAKTSEKVFVDLHKSGSSLGEIYKSLKVPRSSVQTIVRNYKHYGTTQPSYRSGRRNVLSRRYERTLVRKVQGRSHCSKTAIKKPDYGLQLHMGTKIILFEEMSLKNCLAIMTIVVFGGKRGRRAS